MNNSEGIWWIYEDMDVVWWLDTQSPTNSFNLPCNHARGLLKWDCTFECQNDCFGERVFRCYGCCEILCWLFPQYPYSYPFWGSGQSTCTILVGHHLSTRLEQSSHSMVFVLDHASSCSLDPVTHYFSRVGSTLALQSVPPEWSPMMTWLSDPNFKYQRRSRI